MKNNKISIIFFAFFGLLLSVSCRDVSLYPLPYEDQTFGAYLRMYHIRSNVFDANNLGASAFEVVFEAVDAANGDNLQEVEFWASHRRTGLTNEVLVKTVPGSIFTSFENSSGSTWKRSTVTITANETLSALSSLTTDPDSPTSGLVPFPGGLLINDQIIFRWVMVMKDGKRFSVNNPQGAVNPDFAKKAEANTTTNITTGQFYSAPSIFTVPVRALAIGSWIGTYSLTQTAIWSPNHSYDFHANFPNYLKEILFPDQTVTLSVPAGGLSTEREFQVQYRNQTVTMRINLEPPGTVYIPLQYSQINCRAERGLFWTMPTPGRFVRDPNSTVTLTPPLPTGTVDNRGTFNTAQTGLVAGQVMTIGIDDDSDEYGLRNGYCTWTRRVRLTLTKL